MRFIIYVYQRLPTSVRSLCNHCLYAAAIVSVGTFALPLFFTPLFTCGHLQGNPIGQNGLGYAYLHGRGVSQVCGTVRVVLYICRLYLRLIYVQLKNSFRSLVG